MNYNGIEIFFQNLGNADSIFVRHWDNGVLTNILIDGGWQKSAEDVAKFLDERGKESGIKKIHHVICSHAHDDHAAGLVELVNSGDFEIGQAWVHDTRSAHQVLTQSRASFLKSAGAKHVLESIQKSEETRHELLFALEAADIPVSSPFLASRPGPLIVLGPSIPFFEAQMQKLGDEAVVEAWEEGLAYESVLNLLGEEYISKAAADDEEKDLGSDPTGPENEVSTVIALVWDNKMYLFTGDVGCEGLADVETHFSAELQKVRWMQVPHHGSRRNMNQSLIDHLAPETAYISCEGSKKHPSQKLVNALKAGGGKVFSTHYSVSKSSWLRHHAGTVPDLGTTTAVPLYDKD